MAKSASSQELLQSRNELLTTLEELSSDLQDLIASVRAVENDPYRFGLDIDEVSRRRTLVNDISGEIESMRKELQETVTTSTADGRKGGLPNPADFDNVHDNDDDYAEFEEQQQQEIMHEQDEQLDGVFRTVGNLRAQASDMGRELEEQAVLIDEVDTLADRVGGKLQDGMKRVGHIIRKNEGKFVNAEASRAIELTKNRFCLQLLHWRANHCADSTIDLTDSPLISIRQGQGLHDCFF